MIRLIWPIYYCASVLLLGLGLLGCRTEHANRQSPSSGSNTSQLFHSPMPDTNGPGTVQWWEQNIRPGMTWKQVVPVLEKARRAYREPRRMSQNQMMDWASRIAQFTGHLYRNPDFLAAVRIDRDYWLFSRQGFYPTTAHQLVIVFCEDQEKVLRVVFRKVADRPCY